MSDRHLFRAWLPELNKMVTPTKLHYFESGIAVEYKDNGERCLDSAKYNILMQCTGLRDKNGNLIYEGDELNNATFNNDVFTVIWNHKRAEFDVLTDGYESNVNLYLAMRDNNVRDGGDIVAKIVGNIYESEANP